MMPRSGPRTDQRSAWSVDGGHYCVGMTYPRPQTLVGWLVYAVVVIGSTTACGVFLIWDGVDPARAYFAGTPGQVTVSECRWESQKPRGWDCQGAFNGPGVAIPEVRIRYRLDAEPTNPVDTVVSGPKSTTAWTPGVGLLLPIVSGSFIVSIAFAFALYYGWRDLYDWWRQRRERARKTASAIAEREKMRREIADLRQHLREIETDLKGG
jgi:hypothetical protein